MNKSQIFEQIKPIIEEEFIKKEHSTFPDFFNKIEGILKESKIRDKESFPQQKQSTILVSQFNGIGDAILTTGFIRELKANYPNYKLIFICNYETASIFESCPYIDQLFAIHFQSYQVLSLIKDLFEFTYNNLWNEYIEMAISPHTGENNVASMVVNWFNSNNRIGYGENNWWYDYTEEENKKQEVDLQGLIYDNCLLTNHIQSPSNCIKDVDRKYYILYSLHKKINHNHLECWIKLANLERMKLLTEDCKGKKIAIAIGGQFPAKRYSIIKYVRLIHKIYTYEKIKPTFYIIGGKDNTTDYQYLIDSLSSLEDNIQNCVNMYSIQEIVTLLSLMDFYIGNDTGAVHIASIFNYPIIELMQESVKYEQIHPLRLSAYQRYKPYTEKAYVIRPKEQLPLCENMIIHGHCIFKLNYNTEEISPINLGHCINQIRFTDIFSIYKSISENTEIKKYKNICIN